LIDEAHTTNRTVARARQLETEERARLRGSERDGTRAFSDDPEQYPATMAAPLTDDDMSFFEDGLEADAYRDELTDDEDDDVFGQGHSDDDEIGLTVQEPPGLQSKVS
jgi:hypothetical protein